MITTSPAGDQAQSELISLTNAAEQLGVHYMTAYRYVRTGRMTATKQGGKWWVTAADLAEVQAVGTGVRPKPATIADHERAPGERKLRVQPFSDRLVAGDTRGCWELVTAALTAGATPVELHTGLLQPALVAIGDGWCRGDLSVADEHRATATASRLLGQMGPLFRHAGRRRGTVVIGGVSGDPHALPAAILSDLLCDRRFEVIDLGANTPTASFLGIAAGADDLVGIGLCATLDDRVSQLELQVCELRDALPEVTIVAGVPSTVGANPSRLVAAADAVSLDATEACEAFEAACAKKSTAAGSS